MRRRRSKPTRAAAKRTPRTLHTCSTLLSGATSSCFHLADRTSADLVKRVVGLPGETVEMRDGRVYVDGELLEEPYLTGFDDSTVAPEVVPEGHYYVLGDNRAVSFDSRSLGPISQSQIIGKAWISYWPLDRLNVLDADSPPLQ